MKTPQTLGIIGGTGPESTVDYYRALIATYRARKPNGSQPLLIINSVDNQRLLAMVAARAFEELSRDLLGEIAKLEHAGADFGLLAANTPHIVFDKIQPESPIPLISIVEATCEAAKMAGFKRLGLIGTRFTMQADFYPKAFAKGGLTVVLPEAADQDYIHEKYMDELVRGIFLPETRAGLMEIAARLHETREIDALILGGTELPLILRGAESASLPFLDTAKIHVDAAVSRLLA